MSVIKQDNQASLENVGTSNLIKRRNSGVIFQPNNVSRGQSFNLTGAYSTLSVGFHLLSPRRRRAGNISKPEELVINHLFPSLSAHGCWQS